MNSKKESSLARLLLPFSCLIIILVSVFNIHLSQRVSKLSITVENQENRISSLESLCGRRKYQGYQNIINKAVQKLSISNGYELKVRESAKQGEKSKIIWATKLSDEKKKTKATARKEDLKVFKVSSMISISQCSLQIIRPILILLDFLIVRTVAWKRQ